MKYIFFDVGALLAFKIFLFIYLYADVAENRFVLVVLGGVYVDNIQIVFSVIRFLAKMLDFRVWGPLFERVLVGCVAGFLRFFMSSFFDFLMKCPDFYGF